jgi:hypothetical protein
MLPDAAPHFVSMLRALCGGGQVNGLRAEIQAAQPNGTPGQSVSIACRYEHASGSTDARLHLVTCQQRPRPAWYAINNRRVEREIALPAYDQFFTSGDRQVPLEDPLGLLVARFVDGAREGRVTDPEALCQDQRNVERLYEAACDEFGQRSVGEKPPVRP